MRTKRARNYRSEKSSQDRFSSFYADEVSGQQRKKIKVWQSFSFVVHRALYNRRKSLHYFIPPSILGAFYNKEKNILFIDIEQAISQKCQN